MGKPFQKELDQAFSTLRWALDQDVIELNDELIANASRPLYIVGSGGSLSACYYAASLYTKLGMMAKAITPLEIIYSQGSLRGVNILFISASGKNTDILFAYRTAIKCEPNRVFNLCMQAETPLAALSKGNSLTKNFQFNVPTGKDGFLATNSLIAFFAILHKAFYPNDNPTISKITVDYISELEYFMSKITPEHTLTVLHAGWGQSVAIDIESKLAEAALSDVLISDWRNFGHGRHHWFDKRVSNSAIIALITPDELELANRTLAILPSNIPVLKIQSDRVGSDASIELLIKSFHFVDHLGRLQGIDPGKPGVPAFGRKLYHLNYQKFYKKIGDGISEDVKIAIIRKSGAPSYESMTQQDRDFWLKKYKEFAKKIKSVTFGSIVFDYDGTICSSQNRLIGIDRNVGDLIVRFLSAGIVIGIATGRGRSVRQDLQSIIPKQYWNQVVIGYYNCSDLGLLGENDIPDKKLPINPRLQTIFQLLKNQSFPTKLNAELKPHQIVIEIAEKNDWSKVRLKVIDFIIGLNIGNIQILESTHSMDIIDQTDTNKLNIIGRCNEISKSRNSSELSLCIGDKGRWPGNDYQLLSSLHSLSVDEVSSVADTCWNLAKPGIKNVDATIYYLSCLKISANGLKFSNI